MWRPSGGGCLPCSPGSSLDWSPSSSGRLHGSWQLRGRWPAWWPTPTGACRGSPARTRRSARSPVTSTGALASDGGPRAHLGDRVVRARPQEGPDDLAHLVQRLGAVEDGLVVRDVVVGRAHLDQVERAVLHLPELVDLAV